MQKQKTQRQLLLFPGQWVSWETLPVELRGRTVKVLSLLLEEALNSKESTEPEDDNHE